MFISAPSSGCAACSSLVTRWNAATRLTPPSRHRTSMSRASGSAFRKARWRCLTWWLSQMFGQIHAEAAHAQADQEKPVQGDQAGDVGHDGEEERQHDHQNQLGAQEHPHGVRAVTGRPGRAAACRSSIRSFLRGIRRRPILGSEAASDPTRLVLDRALLVVGQLPQARQRLAPVARRRPQVKKEAQPAGREEDQEKDHHAGESVASTLHLIVDRSRKL